ncbi:conserved hypothetical protein [Vibrio crassostreae]|uniref:Uncharacterized protein n=1 Tax=Vibrio crassostreae TaxID=246167 RepID=A0A822MTY6_9VIBR|nr:hypothetical protein [Vibrio crassostreae]MDH5950386.1 hypothetical protein [Vibrio crassostreae]TCN06175.1 hypothetical protein EDB35_114154 [Vibrio crassostreae]TCU05415.1 hypothetical protein EDB32_1162 [Vibrio crassostreae]CAK1770519.1 conserved hypothetical protein [Vibrio crassostreae]CAK1777679.1 conserved hypothetical protein [Vibrio crassostreae]
MWTHPLPTQCPPQDAKPVNGTLKVYRLVETVPSTDKDWLPYSELEKIEPPKVPHEDFDDFVNCVKHGISVFTKLRCVKGKRKMKKFKGFKIIEGNITSNDGVVLQTYKPSHHTWWLKTDNPSVTFSEVIIDDK